MIGVIVPNTLRDAIHAAIDKALNGRACPQDTRDELYRQLLVHYDEHGEIPDFELTAAGGQS